MFRVRALALAVLVPLASSPLLSSCKSDTYESGAAAGKTIQEAASEIDAGIAAVDATTRALNALVDKTPGDKSAQFKTYSKELDTLEEHATNVRDLSAEMDAHTEEYFAKWDQQIATITNEDIRERSEDRRKNVDKAFAKIREKYAEARDEFKPMLADLTDIRTALAADLTPGGIDAVRKSAGKVAKQTDDVKESLSALAAEYRKLEVGLSKMPAPSPAK